jgi:hypothetical protein
MVLPIIGAVAWVILRALRRSGGGEAEDSAIPKDNNNSRLQDHHK